MGATIRTRSDEVLEAARDTASVIADAQVEQLVQAVQWVELHPGDDDWADQGSWSMRPLELAGEGAPAIDESAVAEFALAVGMKHEPGARFIADALELAHRLPRIWGRVMAGEVPVWKARRVAQSTLSLSLEAAAAVDRHLAIIVRKCSYAEIERQVERARAEHDPAETERRRREAAEQRHVRFHFRSVTADGLVAFDGIADLADAVAFDT